jgi:hypothetical protein
MIFLKYATFISIMLGSAPVLGNHPGTRIVEQNGYQGCVELSNERVRVVLEPNCGGRVLVYALDGKNVLYVDPNQDGWTYDGTHRIDPSGGRFDIGPEHTTPKHDSLWLGKWTVEITGPRSARMISQRDPDLGIQLIRAFSLAFKSSHLRCTQIIKNLTEEPQRYCHWSRTLATGGGICLVPLNPRSRFPKGYLLYGPGDTMGFKPMEEPNIRVRDGILEIIGPPSQPKLAIDSDQDWIAYITRQDQLLLKRFSTHTGRVYGEMAGNNASIWYFKNRCCEIEPIGPWDSIDPGKSLAFQESWWLVDYAYPQDRRVDLPELKRRIEEMQR